MKKQLEGVIADRFKMLTQNLGNSIKIVSSLPFQVNHRLNIDCNCLPNYKVENKIYTHPKFKAFFSKLEAIQNPVIYYFEIVSKHTNEELFELLSEYKGKNHKNFPALKKAFDSETRVLYIGKKKQNLKSRMFVHLGYYKVHGTQGLQLCHWAVDQGLKLRLNIIELPFDKATAGLITHYEIELAKLLKPLAGKHR